MPLYDVAAGRHVSQVALAMSATITIAIIVKLWSASFVLIRVLEKVKKFGRAQTLLGYA